MSLDTNKRIARRIVEDGWNRGDRAIIETLYAADVANPGLPPGREAVIHAQDATRAAFPDCRWTIDALITEGETVVVRWTAVGTHTGDLLGIPPTGTEVTIAGVTTFRIVDGLVREWWRVADDLGMLQQMGLLPNFSSGNET